MKKKGLRYTKGPWKVEVDENTAIDRPVIRVIGPRVIDRSKLTKKKYNGHNDKQTIAYIYTPTEPVGPQGGQKVTRATMEEAEGNAYLISKAWLLPEVIDFLAKTADNVNVPEGLKAEAEALLEKLGWRRKEKSATLAPEEHEEPKPMLH